MNKPDRTPFEPFGGTARKRASYLSRAVQSGRNLASRLISMCPVRFSLGAGFTSRAQLGQTQVRRSASQSQTQVPSPWQGIDVVVDPDCPPDTVFFIGIDHGTPEPTIVVHRLDLLGRPQTYGRDYGGNDRPVDGDSWIDPLTGDVWDFTAGAWTLRNAKPKKFDHRAEFPRYMRQEEQFKRETDCDLDEEFAKMLRERGAA